MGQEMNCWLDGTWTCRIALAQPCGEGQREPRCSFSRGRRRRPAPGKPGGLHAGRCARGPLSCSCSGFPCRELAGGSAKPLPSCRAQPPCGRQGRLSVPGCSSPTSISAFGAISPARLLETNPVLGPLAPSRSSSGCGGRLSATSRTSALLSQGGRGVSPGMGQLWLETGPAPLAKPAGHCPGLWPARPWLLGPSREPQCLLSLSIPAGRAPAAWEAACKATARRTHLVL